jgi:carboxyl-terminal processing protease
MLNEAISMLENNYVEQMDFTRPEEVNFEREDAKRPASVEESRNIWIQYLKNEVLLLKINDDKSLKEINKELLKKYSNARSRLASQSSDDTYKQFINTMSGLWDPHTNWLSPEDIANFKINMSLSLEGIGAVLQGDGEHTRIIRIIAGGPADRQGQLAPNQKIIGVAQKDSDFEDIVGWPLDEVVSKIRGPKGSTVRLRILDLDNSIKVVTITRDKVKLESQAAQKAVITLPLAETSDAGAKPLRIGVIKLPAFYLDFDAYRQGKKNFRSSTRDVIALIRELEEENIDGLIMDLRANGGGSLREATTLTDLFINRGPVVQIRNSDNEINRGYRSQRPALYNGPLLVLINHLSASASEIFAGAIQDYRRGIVVGEQSYGKGTVQTLTNLTEGQLKLTTAKFYRVNGDSTQHRGVVPDIHYPSIFDFDEVGESSLEHALKWDTIHAANHEQVNDIETYLVKLANQHKARMSNTPDYENLLARIDYLNERKSNSVVSLNEKERRKEIEKTNQRILELANSLRNKKSQPLFSTIEELEEEEKRKSTERMSNANIRPEEDFLLRESAHILSDFINSTVVEVVNRETPASSIAN